MRHQPDPPHESIRRIFRRTPIASTRHSTRMAKADRTISPTRRSDSAERSRKAGRPPGCDGGMSAPPGIMSSNVKDPAAIPVRPSSCGTPGRSPAWRRTPCGNDPGPVRLAGPGHRSHRRDPLRPGRLGVVRRTTQRVAAYALVVDGDTDILLVRAGPLSATPAVGISPVVASSSENLRPSVPSVRRERRPGSRSGWVHC